MRFSWRALLLAPLTVPVITGAVLAVGTGGNMIQAFFFFGGLTAVFSYGATVGLLLPAVLVAGRFVRLTVARTGLVGLVLGVVLCAPATWVTWKSTGPDSGPPTEPYLVWLARWGLGWCWPFVAGGLVNGLCYGWLARSTPAPGEPASAAPSAASPPAG